ncbi:MAG: zinc ribbon domain-containing protein [Clostridiales bacterium]|nr:zinc ribbon domain-containing protein [Clostridiales bacterium]
MPFYTFTCNSCGKRFEVRCTIAEKDSGSIVCPGCGANELDRVFEGFSVAVKGSSCPGRDGGSPCPSAGRCGGCCGNR